MGRTGRQARWGAPPEEPYRYTVVANEFWNVASHIVSADELPHLSGLVVDLAERSMGRNDMLVWSAPLLHESGYLSVVEFRRAPEGIDAQFQEVRIKIAPYQND